MVKRCANSIYFHEYTDFEIVSGECAHSFPVHIHKHLCVGCITDGCAAFIINNRSRVLLTEDWYCVPPYTPHVLASIDNKNFRYSVYCFKSYATPKAMNDLVADAIAYIETAAPEFNIDELAKAVHISKYHLDRIFKEQVGITPYQFYLYQKIKRIRYGLQTHVALADLTFALHFSDQSHLCNTFKKHMGISPAQYARSYRFG